METLSLDVWKSPRSRYAHVFISEDVALGRVFERSLCNQVTISEGWEVTTQPTQAVCHKCVSRLEWQRRLFEWMSAT